MGSKRTLSSETWLGMRFGDVFCPAPPTYLGGPIARARPQMSMFTLIHTRKCQLSVHRREQRVTLYEITDDIDPAS